MSASYELSLITRYFGGVGMHAVRAGILSQAEKAAAAATANGLLAAAKPLGKRAASTDRLSAQAKPAAKPQPQPAAPKPFALPEGDQELIDVLFARPSKH